MDIARLDQASSQGLLKYILYRFPHPLYPTALYVPISLTLSFWALLHHPMAWSYIILWFFVGLFSWTIVEYGLHRFIFHLTEIKEPWKTIASGLHMAHHDEPNIKNLIVAPPVTSFFFGALIFLIFWAISQNISIAALMISGLLVGYCLYEWVHYGSHQYKMTSWWSRPLKKYHLQHHFKHPNSAFGVTTSFWDRIFGTYPSQ